MEVFVHAPEQFENLLLSFPDDVAIIHKPSAIGTFAFDLTSFIYPEIGIAR